MDEIEAASAVSEAHDKLCLRRHKDRPKAPERESATECRMCGEEIPEGRRRAIPGVVLCVTCQQEAEAHGS